jgi:hypothetical protein
LLLFVVGRRSIHVKLLVLLEGLAEGMETMPNEVLEVAYNNFNVMNTM